MNFSGMKSLGKARDRHRRRGAIAILVAVTTVMMMAFGMLVVDIGLMYSAKNDLQRAADAAALAGASAFLSDAGQVQDNYVLGQSAYDRSSAYSVPNETLRAGTFLEISDVTVGRHDFDYPTQPLGNDGRWNGVEVITRRTSGSTNGPVGLAFAKIFGNQHAQVTATARAAFIDRVAGYRILQVNNLMPFTIQELIYQDMLANGTDNYTYYDESVVNQSDNIREFRLAPWKWQDAEEQLEALATGTEGEGAGNFGILNVGVGNTGTSTVVYQIENGISGDELVNEFGTDELIFYDESEGARTYNSTGTPGGHTSLKQVLASKVGQVVGFFIHTELPMYNGSNAVYKISGIRFGRVMAVEFTGNPNQRALVLQPVSYTSDAIIIHDEAPSTDGQLGRIALVR